ncbi:MAG: aldehyde dehydrogenase [Alphaproteobacteria bacterium]|nr:aldehyde dehydrogenase [Alphaproteobacteria bacterium]
MTAITLQRRPVVARILKDRDDALVVTGLGSTTWDTAAAGDHANNFYLWGGMGGAAMVGLGLALAQPKRRVLVLTGDGEMLMGLGALATIGAQRAANLAVVVIDNQHYGETGMQDTHTGAGIDLAGMAAAAGFAVTATVWTGAELERAIPVMLAGAGPVFHAVKVTTDPVPMVLPMRDGTAIKHRFREAVLGRRAFE